MTKRVTKRTEHDWVAQVQVVRYVNIMAIERNILIIVIISLITCNYNKGQTLPVAITVYDEFMQDNKNTAIRN